MKQILQNLKNGETTVVEVPSPIVVPGHLRIQTKLSLISAGTERMIVDFGKSNYYKKAKFVISHEGAGTLFELLRLKKKVISLY